MPSPGADVPVACGLVVRSRLADQVGRVVGGRYRLLAPVGTGASADVYVADDVTLRRRVAVKILRDALAGDEGFLRRFRAEARAVASMRHPGIVTVYDWGEEDGGAFLVLEYLGGGSLRDLLDRGPLLTTSQAARVGLEAARGLDYAHRRGFVHRDIKPANLLFDDEGRLAIADFGIARALAEATWTEPAGAVVGTVRYASPEQARGHSLDGRADVYALTLALVEAVTGTVPFAADTTLATLMARLDRPIPAAAELGPLGRVVEQAGSVESSDRVDAAGLVRALEAAVADLPPPDPLPIVAALQLPVPRHELDPTTTFAPAGGTGPPPAPPPGGGTRPPRGGAAPTTPDPAAASPRADEPAAATSPRRRRRRWRLPLAVVVLAAAVGAGVWFGRPLLTPTYAVPSLQGLTVADATAHARPHFTVAVHEERVTGATRGAVLGQHPAPAVKRRGGTITVDVSIGNELEAVPNLAGARLSTATDTLSAAGLALHAAAPQFSTTVPAGAVIDWSPKGQAAVGDVITVVPSEGPEFVTMPDLVSVPTTTDQATTQLAALGFPATAITTQQDFSDTVPKGDVIATAPAAGQQADRAATVTLDVSKGPDLVAVPDVRGKSIGAAEAALHQAGFTAQTYGPPGASIVVDQRPPPGTPTKRGSAVLLVAF